MAYHQKKEITLHYFFLKKNKSIIQPSILFGIVVVFVVIVWKKLFYEKYFLLRFVSYLYIFG
jgi:hypothetical protein